MGEFVAALMVGLAMGCIYGLIGLGFTAVYNACTALNFALGDFTLLGAVVAFLCLSYLQLPFVVMLFSVMVAGVLIGLALQRLMVSPLFARKASLLTIILATMAFGMVISGITGVASGYLPLQVDPFLGYGGWQLMGSTIVPQNVLIMILTAVTVLAFWLLLRRTRFGLALRATGFNKDAASLAGINTSRMVGYAFIISGIICGIAGAFVAPFGGAHPDMGLPLAIKGFIAAIVGGMGNPYAAVVGGLIIGLISSFVTTYGASADAEVAVFILLLVILVARPHGIFGEE